MTTTGLPAPTVPSRTRDRVRPTGVIANGARAGRARPLLLAAVLLVAGTRPVAAQPPAGGAPAAGEAARKTAAKKLAREATRQYNLSRFREALDAYTKAYETFPAAGLLFNIGQCHRGLGDHEQAIRSYEAYLREKPDAANRNLVNELVAEEESLLAAQRAAEAERRRAEAAGAEAQDAERRRLAREREAAEERRRSAALVEASPPLVAASGPAGRDRAGRSVFRAWWFWTAVGAVALAAGGAIYLDAQRDTILPGGSLGTHDER